MTSRDLPSTPVVLAGVHGHGHSHLSVLEQLAARSGGPWGIHLAGVCDPVPPTGELREQLGDLPVTADLESLLDLTSPTITIVCTPIHTHADLALLAAAGGSHVLLEKPPTPTLAEFARLANGLAEAQVACQVGFQSLGSAAIDHIRDLVGQGAIGELTGIGAAGAWVRDTSYYARARWAGRRTLDGVQVVDGVLTNPFAHAVATALRLAGAQGGDRDGGPAGAQIRQIEVELFRANEIEADDTSCVRVTTVDGLPIVVAATLCASTPHDPYVVLHGSRGRITFAYKRSEVRLRGAGRDEGPGPVRTFPTQGLLENLAEHLHRRDTDLLVPLAETSAFMQVVEAIRTAPAPSPIGAPYARRIPAGEQARFQVDGIDPMVDACAARLALFSELGPAWAPPGGTHVRRPHDDREVA